jgi:hypothetical protein
MDRLSLAGLSYASRTEAPLARAPGLRLVRALFSPPSRTTKDGSKHAFLKAENSNGPRSAARAVWSYFFSDTQFRIRRAPVVDAREACATLRELSASKFRASDPSTTAIRKIANVGRKTTCAVARECNVFSVSVASERRKHFTRDKFKNHNSSLIL